MADVIEWQIAANMKTALSTLATYPDNSTPTVEYERSFLKINNRYPYIAICGPWVESDMQTHKTTYDDISYMIKYYVKANDENETANSELPKLTENVASDIVTRLQLDTSRGGLAQKTEVLADGYAYDASFEDDIGMEFYVYVTLSVKALINIDDISVAG